MLRYYRQLAFRAQEASQSYPEWIVRVYHDKNPEVAAQFAKDAKNVDFCDVRNLPHIGNISGKMPLGKIKEDQFYESQENVTPAKCIV